MSTLIIVETDEGEPEDLNAGIIIELKYTQMYDGLEKACKKSVKWL